MKEPLLSYLDRKNQDNYPSGSTISYLNGRFYIMGDDASELLVLNRELEETNRIPLFPRGENIRTPKAVKADIEASAVVSYDGKEAILLLGSGSLSPHRDSAFLVDPVSRKVHRHDFTPFYNQLRNNFSQLNVEGATIVGEDLVLGVRANRSYPDNYLVIASSEITSPQFKRKILIKMPVEHAGISGLDFDRKHDVLFITFSSEDTPNAYDDGTPGDSYLAMVPDATRKLQQPELTIASLVTLTDLSNEFLQQKIESVSLIDGKDQLLLVADDDLGNTTFFKLQF